MAKSFLTKQRERDHQCLDCGVPVDPQYSRCDLHMKSYIKRATHTAEYRKRAAVNYRKRYAEREQAGLCTGCGKVAPREGRKTCAPCAKRATDWAARNPERVKANQAKWQAAQPKTPRVRHDKPVLHREPAVQEALQGRWREYMRQYWIKHPDRYEAHKAKCRVTSKINREKRDAAKLKYSAKAASAPSKPDREAGDSAA